VKKREKMTQPAETTQLAGTTTQTLAGEPIPQKFTRFLALPREKSQVFSLGP
jgi:hypothetical protein